MDLHDVLSKWCQTQHQEVPQTTKPYVHLQINQLDGQKEKKEEEDEDKEA